MSDVDTGILRIYPFLLGKVATKLCCDVLMQVKLAFYILF